MILQIIKSSWINHVHVLLSGKIKVHISSLKNMMDVNIHFNFQIYQFCVFPQRTYNDDELIEKHILINLRYQKIRIFEYFHPI